MIKNTHRKGTAHTAPKYHKTNSNRANFNNLRPLIKNKSVLNIINLYPRQNNKLIQLISGTLLMIKGQNIYSEDNMNAFADYFQSIEIHSAVSLTKSSGYSHDSTNNILKEFTRKDILKALPRFIQNNRNRQENPLF